MPSSPHQLHDLPDRTISAHTLQSMLVSLTLIKVRAQMLGRWARRSDIPDADAVLATSTAIDKEVAKVAEQLNDPPQPGQADPSMDGSQFL